MLNGPYLNNECNECAVKEAKRFFIEHPRREGYKQQRILRMRIAHVVVLSLIKYIYKIGVCYASVP